MSERLRDFLRLLGVGFVLMGMFLLGAAGLLIYRQKAITRGWASTTGEVVSGFVYSVQSNRVGHRGTMYGARWLVRYRVGDSLFDSTTNAGFEMKDRNVMQKLVDEKPVGSKVQLMYSPEDSGRIVLAESMLSRDSPVLKIIESGSACFVVGLLLILVGPRIGSTSIA
jgi:Protein of unknown function (DUF3592)